MSAASDFEHPVLDRPWEYEILELRYHRCLDNEADSYIDLTLQRGSTVRHLRFLGPRQLLIDKGFPNSSGLCIQDVSHRMLDGISIRVDNFEAHGGCPTFWAREVIDLDRSDPE